MKNDQYFILDAKKLSELMGFVEINLRLGRFVADLIKGRVDGTLSADRITGNSRLPNPFLITFTDDTWPGVFVADLIVGSSFCFV